MPKQIPSDLKVLSRIFSNRNIPTDTIAFYNHPHFMTEEQKDASFLELYAAWVRMRPRDTAYDSHVRRTVPQIASIVAREISKDGQLGTCVDASQMVTKMLEEEGIWCYSVNGALSINDPRLPNTTHFWLYDEVDVAGHVWVVAPPFEIVDVVLQTQPYTRCEADLLPKYLAVETAKAIQAEAFEYIAPSILQSIHPMPQMLPKDIHRKLYPGLVRSINFFPSWQIRQGTTTLRYAHGGVSLSDAPSLHSIKNRTWNGLSAGELYDKIVKPKLETKDKG